MARIAGVDLPKNKRIETGLTYIFGIGLTTSRQILSKANVDGDKRVHALDEDELRRIRNIIQNDYKVEGSLRTEITMNVKRLMDIGCYRGLRHRRGLPVHGQNTKNNARTRKGRKKSSGVVRKG